MNAAKALGEHLRQMRRQLGWSLRDVERKSDGRWKPVVIGSYERGDRNPTWVQTTELIKFYGVHRVELVAPGDVVVRADEHGTGEQVAYVVTAPGLARPIECCDRDEAIARAALVPGGVVGFRTIAAVRPVVDLSRSAEVEQAEAASPLNDRGGAS